MTLGFTLQERTVTEFTQADESDFFFTRRPGTALTLGNQRANVIVERFAGGGADANGDVFNVVVDFDRDGQLRLAHDLIVTQSLDAVNFLLADDPDASLVGDVYDYLLRAFNETSITGGVVARQGGFTSPVILDPETYVAGNPDIAASGLSILQHYQVFGEIGILDGSRADSVTGFDPIFYRSSNPDVRAAVENDVFTTYLEHYLSFGLAEGRLGELAPAESASAPEFDAIL